MTTEIRLDEDQMAAWVKYHLSENDYHQYGPEFGIIPRVLMGKYHCHFWHDHLDWLRPYVLTFENDTDAVEFKLRFLCD